MHSPNPHILMPMLRKFEMRQSLDELDRQAFLSLPFRMQSFEPNVYMVREGDRPDRCSVIVEGLAFRHKLTEAGRRQILSVQVAGDFVDLESALLNIADHNLQSLTRCEVAFIPREAVRRLILSHPNVGMAMWVDTLIDASIFREWVLNVGQRDGLGRVAHLLCELGRRFEVAGLGGPESFQLPMTQEQLGDATGLTPVHVNRVMKRLGEDGLIRRVKRDITVLDWPSLRSLAGFSETYLHLDQVVRGQREDRNL